MIESFETMRAMFMLDGCIAVVAGGAGGIGGACAKGFAAFGAKVILLDIDAEALQSTKEEFAQLGSDADTYVCDITNKETLRQVIGDIQQKYGKIDIMLNNIAVTNRKPLLEMSDDEWNTIIDINLNGAYLLLKAVGDVMVKQRHGKIINILSTGAYRYGANFTAYGASKSGLSALTKGLAIEWAPYGLHVNGIAPTATDTNFTKDYYAQNPEKLEATTKNHPYGRIGKPEDYIGAAVYLASSASDFVNGEVIIVDSGKTVK